jgi:hypothetical protein
MRDNAMWILPLIFLYSSTSIPIAKAIHKHQVGMNKLQAHHLITLDAVHLQNELPIAVTSPGQLLAPPPPVNKQQTKNAVADCSLQS